MSAPILIVEDDGDSSELIATTLDLLGLPSLRAQTADEAIGLIGATAPRMVIIDLKLPGARSGWDVLAYLQASPGGQAVKTIAVTGYHSNKVRHDALQAGFNAYQPKPIDPTSFSRVIDDLFGSDY